MADGQRCEHAYTPGYTVSQRQEVAGREATRDTWNDEGMLSAPAEPSGGGVIAAQSEEAT